jgi:glutaryl-CoA dehydrogenase
MVRDTVREWVDDELLPIIGDAYIERKFPKEIIPQLASWACSARTCPRSTAARG